MVLVTSKEVRWNFFYFKCYYSTNAFFVHSLKTANRIGTPVVLARGSKYPRINTKILGVRSIEHGLLI